MRIPFFFVLGMATLGAQPVMAEPGTIVGDADLRDAPGPYAAAGKLPTGTKVDVGVCFDGGTYCYVDANGVTGYVESRLIKVAAGRMDQVEQARLDRIRQQGGLPEEAQMIAAWGDSLTAGATLATDATYPAQAEALFGFARDINNGGIGGQNSTAVAARMNAVPTLLSFTGDEIPAEGPALVSKRSTTPITNQGPHSLAGTVCGIVGMLDAQTDDGGKTYIYHFMRGRPGEAVKCPADSQFRFAAGDLLRQRVTWIWAGTNGAAPDHTVVGDIAAMVTSLGHERYLIGALPFSAEYSEARIAAVKTINAALARQYGDQFVDLAGTLAAAGDGSTGDAADIAAGITPRSLRIDAVHLNARGNAIIAKAWHDATLKLGF